MKLTFVVITFLVLGSLSGCHSGVESIESGDQDAPLESPGTDMPDLGDAPVGDPPPRPEPPTGPQPGSNSAQRPASAVSPTLDKERANSTDGADERPASGGP